MVGGMRTLIVVWAVAAAVIGLGIRPPFPVLPGPMWQAGWWLVAAGFGAVAVRPTRTVRHVALVLAAGLMGSRIIALTLYGITTTTNTIVVPVAYNVVWFLAAVHILTTWPILWTTEDG